MRKNSKKESTNGSVAAQPAVTPAAAAIETAPAVPAKKSANAAKKPARKTAAKKTVAKKSAPAKRSSKTKSQEPSDSEIRIRAYFIAERRSQLGLPGDQAHDWLEARRQLFEEAGLTPPQS